MAIRIRPEDLKKELIARAKSTPNEIRRGMKSAASRGKTLLVRRTPVDRGEMKAAWDVVERGKEITIENDAPHAGIVELGARPHSVSRAGIESIARWARRKFGVDESEARSIAYGVANKLKRKGQEPTYFVRDSMDELQRLVGEEIERSIKASANRRAR